MDKFDDQARRIVAAMGITATDDQLRIIALMLKGYAYEDMMSERAHARQQARELAPCVDGRECPQQVAKAWVLRFQGRTAR